MPPTFDSAAATQVAIAILGGLAVGIERQWSGKASGPAARFAGIRTFTLLGLAAGLSGWLWTAGLTGPSIVILAGVGALVVVAYLAASRHDIDGTTEVSAFVVLTAGVLAGAGYMSVASAIIALTVLLLVEKRRLHSLVKRLDLVEIRAAARFMVMAAVILPLLPAGPFGPFDGIRPRQLWSVVLFFSGLSFLGFLARRVVGLDRGYAAAGLIGGVLSSTSVTLTYSRLSRTHPTLGSSLAAGVLGANAVLFPRVLIASAVLAPDLARTVWPAFIAPTAIGLLFTWIGLRDRPRSTPYPPGGHNPLQIGAALQMALLFQFVLFGVSFARAQFGAQGLYGSAAVLGLADMDALTVSMSRMTSTAEATAMTAATALIIGVLVNTAVKLSMTIAIGRGRFRPLAAGGLVAIGVALATALVMYLRSPAG